MFEKYRGWTPTRRDEDARMNADKCTRYPISSVFIRVHLRLKWIIAILPELNAPVAGMDPDHCFRKYPLLYSLAYSTLTFSGLSAKNSSVARFTPGDMYPPAMPLRGKMVSS